MTIMIPVPAWEGEPLLPSMVESFWGKLTQEHIRLAEAICNGTEGLGALIDKGSLGHVFEHPNDKTLVVKITQEFDDGYTKWLEEFVLQNQDNRHVPQVKLYMRLNNGQSVIVMEALTPFKDAQHTRNVKQQQSMLNTIAEELAEGKADEILDMDMSEDMFNILEFLFTFDTDWIDVDGSNAMFRGDTLVITDPMV